MANFNNVLCGCYQCNDHGVPIRGCCKSCLKADARDDSLKKRGFARFERQVVDIAGFKPASPEQMAEWMAWLSSPAATAAHERLALEKKAALNSWGSYKFDLLRMEKHLDGMWPEEQKKYMIGPMWTAYMHFGNGQQELLKSYDSVKKNIKTDEEYDVAEEAYKTLLQHVNTHGQLISEMPSHEHKRPVKTSVAPPGKGRRTKRRDAEVERSAIAVGSD